MLTFLSEICRVVYMEELSPEQPQQNTVAPVAAKQTNISYSQYSMWLKCPMSWKLSYIDKLKPREESIHFAFGTSIHIAVQAFLEALYTKGALAADSIDCMDLFNKSYNELVKKIPDITVEVIEEFRLDGKAILDYFTLPRYRNKHFPTNKYEFIGIELPLTIPLRNGKVSYVGFLDLVLKDKETGNICIFDFKSSTTGWIVKYIERTKLDQLVLYKRFYSMVHKVPLDKIDVEFIILKRRLLENVGFPPSRIQRITPNTGKAMMKEVETSFLGFVKNGFLEDGSYNRNGQFNQYPGKAKKNCKYCVFKTLVGPDGKKYCSGKETGVAPDI